MKVFISTRTLRIVNRARICDVPLLVYSLVFCFLRSVSFLEEENQELFLSKSSIVHLVFIDSLTLFHFNIFSEGRVFAPLP